MRSHLKPAIVTTTIFVILWVAVRFNWWWLPIWLLMLMFGGTFYLIMYEAFNADD